MMVDGWVTLFPEGLFYDESFDYQFVPELLDGS
jgi:hypothetical protein